MNLPIKVRGGRLRRLRIPARESTQRANERHSADSPRLHRTATRQYDNPSCIPTSKLLQSLTFQSQKGHLCLHAHCLGSMAAVLGFAPNSWPQPAAKHSNKRQSARPASPAPNPSQPAIDNALRFISSANATNRPLGWAALTAVSKTYTDSSALSASTKQTIEDTAFRA
jgi:hypothetical protein